MYRLYKYLKNNCKLRNTLFNKQKYSHKKGSCCQTITNCLTFNISKNSEQDMESNIDNTSVNAVRENTPLRRSDRIAQLKDN